MDFQVYVLLPIIMFIISMIVRIPIKKAFEHTLTLGVGFVGIFMVLGHFVSKIGPVITVIVEKSGSSVAILDVGWPPMAAMAWSYEWVPVLMLLFIFINGLMLTFKWTKTFNIDIWNFWHFIFVAQITNYMTGSVILSIISASVSMILILIFADLSAKDTEEISGIKGISITTLSTTGYYPYGVFINKVFDAIPGIRNINGNPEHIKKKLGVLGQPITIGFLLGAGLAIAAGYEIKEILELAVNIAAVVLILPRMAGILAEGLIPISVSTKIYLTKKFPEMKDARIGMDLAVLLGNPSVIVAGILLMPVALALALVLPGVTFIPLGDLPNIMAAIVMVIVATKGNLFRAVVGFIPVIIGSLYAASYFAPILTAISEKTGTAIEFNGLITSFLDGGNLFRSYMVLLFSGQLWTYLLLPVFAYLIYIAFKHSKEIT